MISKNDFLRYLRLALRYLYDPVELIKNPLLKILPIKGQASSASQLRELLTNAIYQLKPPESLSHQSPAWRIYRTLIHRFIDQFSQAEVAINLGISIRQIRRQEKQALQALTDYLWTTYHLDENQVSSYENGFDLKPDELGWLEKSLPLQPILLKDLMDSVIDTIRPLISRSEVFLNCVYLSEDLALDVQKSPTQQVLVTLLTEAISSTPQGKINIIISQEDEYAQISIYSIAPEVSSLKQTTIRNETLVLLNQLISLSNGKLLIPKEKSSYSFQVILTFPLQKKIPILFIDDNQDTLNLFKRYLEPTRYLAITSRNYEEGLNLAIQTAPQAIILDVMMPDIDGWEILERLRVHPQTGSIPIIVCSILPNEQLASELGAIAFIQKPVSRKSLLQVLDRLTA